MKRPRPTRPIVATVGLALVAATPVAAERVGSLAIGVGYRFGR